MIALDTNILVYAHRPETPLHAAAYDRIQDLVESGRRFGIPMQCVVEFSGVVRHHRIWRQPSSPAQVRAQVEAWLQPPSAWLLTEEDAMLETFFNLLESGRLEGGAVHDARIVACCRLHGVRELWSADRDFSRFSGLRIRNPLLA